MPPALRLACYDLGWQAAGRAGCAALMQTARNNGRGDGPIAQVITLVEVIAVRDHLCKQVSTRGAHLGPWVIMPITQVYRTPQFPHLSIDT